MDKGFLEECLAKGMSLRQIGEAADKSPSTVGYWMRKYGLRATGTEKHQPRGGVDEEVLMIMIEDELTLREMAEQLGCSVSTVRHWLTNYGLQQRRGAGRPRRSANGSKFAKFECRRHGRTEFVLESSGYYRCKRCRSEGVIQRRRKVKSILVAEAGGRCAVCGYDRHPAGLEFIISTPRRSRSGSRSGE